MQITYGTHEMSIDVTAVALSTCMKSSILYIPPDDAARARLFTDPIYGKLKFMRIDGIPYDDKTAIFVDTVANTVHTVSIPDHIRDVYPEEVLTATLMHMQRRLLLRHGSFRDEFPEQKMAVRFLRPSDSVLEIGGNIGRNSLIIASIVNQDSLVTLESDPEIATQLVENRNANGMTFAIEPFALSLRPLMQKGWDTIVSDVPVDGYKKVNTMPLADLRAKYKPFTALVLDCEGAFYYILLDMPDILDGVKTVIMENDYYDRSHKAYIDTTLQERGFTRVYKESLGPEYAFKNFPFAENFFEVWQNIPSKSSVV